MTVKIVVGRLEGFVTSVGLMTNGLPFLCRGSLGNTRGLQFEPAEVRRNAVRELRFLVEYLRSAGVAIENPDALDNLD